MERLAKLSVVVITRNEETDLPGFLRNFVPLAGEIVIVDDGSTDRTEEIALAGGETVRFLRSPRQDGEGFCDQRNKGLEAATGEWQLHVDADMRLTPELADELRLVLQAPAHDVYRFRLEQYWMNMRVRYGGFQYWNNPWLMRRSAVRSWGNKVHEYPVFAVGADRIGQLDGRMVHLNDVDFLERLRKNHQYSPAVADQLAERGETFPLWKLVGMPARRFLLSYVAMKGVLDGRIGFVWAFYQFCGTATIYFIGWSRAHGGSRADER